MCFSDMADTLTRVLTVDDDPYLQEILVCVLEEVGGFTVKSCASGKDALECVEAFMPELILLDVMMPDMDGPTTMLRMRQIPALAKIPVVFVTAKAGPKDVESYRALGAAAVIPKPFDGLKLPDQIRAIWKSQSK